MSEKDELYDCIIIGAGPAGLAAGLYAARDRYKTLLLEKFIPGGQINLTERIENYPGFELISGADLVRRMVGQCTKFGIELKDNSEVTALDRLEDGTFSVVVNDGQAVYRSRTIILAPGSSYRKLGVPGEEKFTGSGVSYCGTCDAAFFKDQHVVAVGGGNTALEETLHLAKFCSKVTLVHRRDEFRADKVLVEELMAKKDQLNIELKLSHTLQRIEGDKHVERAVLLNKKTGQELPVQCQGVFLFVGMVPNTEFLRGFVELDENNFIKADPAYLRTSTPGVFVAGDCRSAAAMQLATAAADGVVAAMMIKEYLRDPDWWNRPARGVICIEGR